MVNNELGHYSIANWQKYQHYKHRRPTWVKLYSSLLADYGFTCLQDASKLLLFHCYLLAADTENRIPADPAWIKKRAMLEGDIDMKPLVEAGFIELNGNASNMLAQRKQTPITEKSRVEKSRVDNMSIGKKKSEGQNIKKVFQAFRSFSPNTRGGKTYEKPIQARLNQGYNPDELIRVIQLAQKDEWHTKTGKCLDLPYLMQQKIVDRFLNQQNIKKQTNTVGYTPHREDQNYANQQW